MEIAQSNAQYFINGVLLTKMLHQISAKALVVDVAVELVQLRVVVFVRVVVGAWGVASRARGWLAMFHGGSWWFIRVGGW